MSGITRTASLGATILLAAALGMTVSAEAGSSGRAPLNAAGASSTDGRVPVLVELFTSEGCSDCPPADGLLALLDTEQPIPAAEAIVLSEHVTYWNHEGWLDPFSMDLMDQRQQDYVRQFGLSDEVTPEFVIDGAKQFTGADGAKLQAAIQQAAAKPKIPVEISGAHMAADGAVQFAVKADAGNAGMFAAVAEDATVSEVARGENAGRTLHHVAVVRVLKDFGSKRADGRTLELKSSDLLAAEKTATPLRLVVFLVNRSNWHVMGIAEQKLPTPAAASMTAASPGH